MGRFDALLNPTKPVTPPRPLREPNAPTLEHTKKEEAKHQHVIAPENLKTGKPEYQISRKPEFLNTRNHEIMKNEKYSTLLQPQLIKQIKQYALEHDLKDYEVIQEAVKAYLEKKT